MMASWVAECFSAEWRKGTASAHEGLLRRPGNVQVCWGPKPSGPLYHPLSLWVLIMLSCHQIRREGMRRQAVGSWPLLQKLSSDMGFTRTGALMVFVRVHHLCCEWQHAGNGFGNQKCHSRRLCSADRGGTRVDPSTSSRPTTIVKHRLVPTPSFLGHQPKQERQLKAEQQCAMRYFLQDAKFADGSGALLRLTAC